MGQAGKRQVATPDLAKNWFGSIFRQTLCQCHIPEETKENLNTDNSSVELCTREKRQCCFILHTWYMLACPLPPVHLGNGKFFQISGKNFLGEGVLVFAGIVLRWRSLESGFSRTETAAFWRKRPVICWQCTHDEIGWSRWVRRAKEGAHFFVQLIFRPTYQ